MIYASPCVCMIGLAVSLNDDNTNGHYINSINKVNLIVLDCTANIYLLRLGEWYSLNINSNLKLNRIYLLLNICITYLLLISLIQSENPYYHKRYLYLYVLKKWNHWLALDCIAIYSNWYVAVMIFSWDSQFRKVKDQYINRRWLNYFWIRDEIERIYYVFFLNSILYDNSSSLSNNWTNILFIYYRAKISFLNRSAAWSKLWLSYFRSECMTQQRVENEAKWLESKYDNSNNDVTDIDEKAH